MTDQDSPIVIAIDGPAGSGKSTVARRVAKKMGLTYLDTGAMYRSVALKALERDIDLDDEEALGELASELDIAFLHDGDNWRIAVNGEDVSEDIRTANVDKAVSPVSAHTSVRNALLDQQRDFADNHGVVAEGRDIGTVVFPDATLKIFLTARADERALRRYKQNVQRAEETGAFKIPNQLEVKEDLKERDEADSTRANSPLIAAADAIELDTSEMDVDQVVDHICFLLRRTLGIPNEVSRGEG